MTNQSSPSTTATTEEQGQKHLETPTTPSGFRH